MITLLLQLLRLLPFLCGGHRQLALENLALHQQLAVYKRTVPRPKLRTTDRLFWVVLARGLGRVATASCDRYSRHHSAVAAAPVACSRPADASFGMPGTSPCSSWKAA